MCEAFIPDDVKHGFKQDAHKKHELLKVLDHCDFTQFFELDGCALEKTRIVLGWYGCNANIIESILQHGFAACSSADTGYPFGAGNYVTLNAKYACMFARGWMANNLQATVEYKNEDGWYGVL